VQVNEGVTLTIPAGAVVKFDSETYMAVSGTLNATGTASDNIIFTSLKDDTYGGDTNGDGSASAPAPGDWYSVSMSNSGRGIFDHCIVRYGGRNSDSFDSNIKVYSDQPLSFKNSICEYSRERGIYLGSNGGGNIISNSIFRNNGMHGLDSANSGDTMVTGNTFTNNTQFGLYLSGSSNNHLIYNNYFENTFNADGAGNNIWNISKTAGTNIIGGSWLGWELLERLRWRGSEWRWTGGYFASV